MTPGLFPWSWRLPAEPKHLRRPELSSRLKNVRLSHSVHPSPSGKRLCLNMKAALPTRPTNPISRCLDANPSCRSMGATQEIWCRPCHFCAGQFVWKYGCRNASCERISRNSRNPYFWFNTHVSPLFLPSLGALLDFVTAARLFFVDPCKPVSLVFLVMVIFDGWGTMGFINIKPSYLGEYVFKTFFQAS